MAARKASNPAASAGASAPAAAVPVFVTGTAPDRRVRSVEAEINAREQIIAEAQRQIHELQHPFQEYPKMVNGLVVQNAKQEAEVLRGTAVIEEVQSAQGVKRTVK